MSICLKDFGVVCALGDSKASVAAGLLQGSREGLVLDSELPNAEAQYVGRVADSTFDKTVANISMDSKGQQLTRNDKLGQLAYLQIADTLAPLLAEFGQHRIAVVIGTSTSGIEYGEQALKHKMATGEYPENYHYRMQEMGTTAQFIADLCQAKGPVYSISTACSSSGKALVSAQALLDTDLADVVIAGGVDSLAKLTVNGFKALASTATAQNNPFAADRDGINIGEAAALFIVTKEQGGIQLLGAAETSDAHHLSAPHPEGEGALRAMQSALAEAHLQGEQVDYVNLHGTGTPKNDDMEAKAMLNACGSKVLCGSTKGMTGHTLGAAGALEAGICWLLLHDEYNPLNKVPANVSDGELDSSLAQINLADANSTTAKLQTCMSNSFAFGGNNISLVIGKQQ
ncbi:beta-ketoacyl-ACP synthase [Moritella sp. Urea-trap-13]|uniref:beta-ketoacyl-ACP synthase n=1 Tax=Moritella sp. Urea-trap-13 TaxID=2058327 RepID=UPI000C326FA6|nr:beta-ketoacyl-ACP synthase [Moritella sp. Urea-trap-13]PKH07066.1 beta-ketoacyl-[acyl-carrier-protein] synthase II [Moritella sp. Urea-trap-13]